ncbi:Flp family type IVb pilin [Pseudarthrobacter sp. MDT3-26]|uniref:Flp family type IVb pilin n=1 Tax=Pseudarthrobacter raffinosi TaxID=2953651 RepID=UPI00208E27D8|nr:Flp family type IVb pilin [Pseudarthrobacter sp. MDT3-26]MCO4263365.1 Flp family type IVb pilin [Pseudarthrobacter sp. MDT3-26]
MFRQLTSQFARLASTLRALGYDQRGATSTEYGILLSFLALAIILGVTAFGQALNVHYLGMTTALKTALGMP